MIIRRIRRSEQEALANLCRKDHRWSRYFHNHEKWLDKALADVASEDRVVLGVFDVKHSEDGTSETCLISCVFLKLSQFENSIEFKNLIIPSDTQNLLVDQQVIVRRLVNKAIRFCEVRGVQKLEIELPQEEFEIISVFLGANFKLVALRERFSPGNLVCTLERWGGDRYYGDPFDTLKFSKWFLHSLIPCEIRSVEERSDGEIIQMEFEVKAPNRAFSERAMEARKKLQGVMLVIEGHEKGDEDIKKLIDSMESKPIIMMITKETVSDQLRTFFGKYGIVAFDRNECIEIAGGEKSSLGIPIRIENVGGVITTLEDEQIIAYAARETFIYYLLSGIHNGLSVSLDGEELVLAIYCPDWQNKGPGIVGLCTIEEIERPTFSELLSKTISENSALSEEDLRFYKTYSENERIAQLVCTRLVLLDNPLRIRTGNWIPTEAIRMYMNQELVENGNNSVYLDEATAANLQRIFKDEGGRLNVLQFSGARKRPLQGFKVGLSFDGLHRDFVESVATQLEKKLAKGSVFYDRFFEGELNVPNLDLILSNIYTKECDLVVVFFSKEFDTRPWCGLEWRNVRSLLFSGKNEGKLMVFKFDPVEIPGHLRLDGYSEIGQRNPSEIAKLILHRLTV